MWPLLMLMLTRVSGVFSPSVPNHSWPSFLSWPPFLIWMLTTRLSQPLQIVVDVKRTEDRRSAAHGSTWEIWWVWYLIGRLAFLPKRAVVQDQIGRVHPHPRRSRSYSDRSVWSIKKVAPPVMVRLVPCRSRKSRRPCRRYCRSDNSSSTVAPPPITIFRARVVAGSMVFMPSDPFLWPINVSALPVTFVVVFLHAFGVVPLAGRARLPIRL